MILLQEIKVSKNRMAAGGSQEDGDREMDYWLDKHMRIKRGCWNLGFRLLYSSWLLLVV